MNKVTLLLCALALLVSIATFASADSCLQYPPSLRKGKKCSDAFADCQLGTFCSYNGVCTESVGENQPCDPVLSGQCIYPFYCHEEDKKCTAYRNVGEKCDVIECGYGLTCDSENEVCVGGYHGDQGCTNNDHCRGNLTCSGGACAANANGRQCIYPFYCHEEDKKCTAYRNVGEKCDVIACGPGLTCDFENEICVGGFHGDQGCTSNDHCRGNLTCSGGVCAANANGLECDSDFECVPGSFCDRDGKCATKKTFGTCQNGHCASGYVCIEPAPSAEMQCIEEHSLRTGEYCGGENAVCSGANRCYGNYCAKRSVKHCTGNGQCSDGELCTCGGRLLINNQQVYNGVGTCSGNGCRSRLRRLEKCVEENCNYGFQPDYKNAKFSPKSCLHFNCQDELEAYKDCSGASLLSPLLLSLVLPLLALLRL
eukprot:CAMPEP_0197016938 /NCGR_PEP_ID=MMETSP1380-20130617/79253_1 /TAXON_ID=5936 /ORGANISM="Euplotes crassus, Strain CT5" /LENGTH=425 /DNA_ID=CAMNT_0042443969 /DNA_START=32 /DNA_END=1309 /DNA_ORIENTATION=+